MCLEIGFLFCSKHPLLKADGVYALHRKILQDAPKLWKWTLKHPQGFIIWVAIEEGQKVETPGWGPKMEFCRKKCGKSWEVDRGLWLERGLENNHRPGTGSLRHMGMFVLYLRMMSIVSGRRSDGVEGSDAERQCHGPVGVSLLIAYAWLLRPLLVSPGRTGLWPRSRALSSDTSENLTSVAWPFSCATSCISCSILKTWSLLQIMSSYSSWARLSFQTSLHPLASYGWFGWAWCSLLSPPSPAKEWCPSGQAC